MEAAARGTGHPGDKRQSIGDSRGAVGKVFGDLNRNVSGRRGSLVHVRYCSPHLHAIPPHNGRRENQFERDVTGFRQFDIFLSDWLEAFLRGIDFVVATLYLGELNVPILIRECGKNQTQGVP